MENVDLLVSGGTTELRNLKSYAGGGGDSLLCRQCMFHEGGDVSLAPIFSILLFQIPIPT